VLIFDIGRNDNQSLLLINIKEDISNMKTILVEEWVHIPEGGKDGGCKACACSNRRDKDKKSEGKWPQRRDCQELQTHAMRAFHREVVYQNQKGSICQRQDVVRRLQAELLCLHPQVPHSQHDHWCYQGKLKGLSDLSSLSLLYNYN
jgi:hypothetical protein